MKTMKISDFKLAEYFIRTVCKHHNCPFVDVPLEFGKGHGGMIVDGKMVIGEWDKFGRTIFQIISTYVNQSETITGTRINISNEDLNTFYNSVVAILRDMTYSRNPLPIKNSVVGRLNRAKAVWALMRTIVCPVYEKPLKNLRIVYGKTPFIDGAKFLTSEDVPTSDKSQFPFVFSNLEIESQPARDAFLFYEVLRGHEMDPRGIIHDIFTKQELWSKFLSSLRIAYGYIDQVNTFLITLSILADEMGSIDKRMLKKNAKWTSRVGFISKAQYGFGTSTWWYLGLIEKLLEPARGSDWSAYQTMQPFIQDLWNKVEKEKKERGLKELPLEILLRIQGNEFRHQPDLITEGLLADNRVW